MNAIVVQNVPPYDGRYEFDLEQRELTTREWGWIKRLAGYLPMGLDDEALGDPELITVLAAIVLRRNGKIDAQQVPQVFDRLSDGPFGAAITLETDTETEDDASPPPPSSSSNGATSGTSSKTSSETSPPTPNPFGIHVLASSPYGPPRSES